MHATVYRSLWGAGLIAIGVALGASGSVRATDSDGAAVSAAAKKVIVANTTTQPVPVLVNGPIQIGNTNKQPIPVSPRGTSQVAGTVKVGNATNEPVPVVPQGNTRVTGTVNVQNPSGQGLFTTPLEDSLPLYLERKTGSLLPEGGGGVRLTFAVPDGFRLILRQVSFSVVMPPGQYLHQSALIVGPEQKVIWLSPQRENSAAIATGTIDVYCRLDGPQTFDYLAVKNSSAGLGSADVSVSGYLRPLP